MGNLLGLGVVVQIAACAVVGTRLLLLARRTGEIPELAFGSAFWLLGVAGYPMAIAARAGFAGSGLLLAGFAVQDAACLAMALGTFRTFGSGDGRRRALLQTLGAAFALSILGQFAAGGSPDAGPFYWIGFAGRWGAFLWSAADSLHYTLRMRRRLRLDLADPIVVDRFRLWTVTTISICVGFAVFLAVRLGGGAPNSPVVLAVTSVISLVSGTAMWLAFFPPAAYLQRIADRAATTSGAVLPD